MGILARECGRPQELARCGLPLRRTATTIDRKGETRSWRLTLRLFCLPVDVNKRSLATVGHY
jgi:hypothetical protein